MRAFDFGPREERSALAARHRNRADRSSDPRGDGETVLLWTYNLKPEITLLADMQISQWFRDHMTGAAKYIIGEAREKFSQIAGPQGGGTLNGAAMKQEGQAMMDKCIEDLKLYVDGSQPLTFVIG